MSKNKLKLWWSTGVFATLLLLAGLLWLARPDGQSAAQVLPSADATLALTVQGSNNYDFGKVSMAAGKVSRQFAIKNESDQAITIEKMYTSCMCTTASLILAGEQFGPYGMPGHGFIPAINQIINPGKEAIVNVVFDPAAHGPAGVGRINRTVSIENNAGQPLELHFTAQVIP